MTVSRILGILFVVLSCIGLAGQRDAQHIVCSIVVDTEQAVGTLSEHPQIRPLRIPATLHTTVNSNAELLERLGRLQRTVIFRGSATELLDVLETYHSAILSTEVQPMRRIEPIANDQASLQAEPEPLVDFQYYIKQTDVPLDTNGNPAPVSSEVVVAVVDSGFDLDHIDLEGIWFTNTGEMGVDAQQREKATNGIDDDNNGFVDDWRGWDFVSDSLVEGDNDPTNGNEHGTFVAGIIAAKVNDFGMCGVAPGVRVLPLKVTDDHPFAMDILAGYEAMLYAADMGVDIINCSWGGTAQSALEQDIVALITAMDIHVVCAAGNTAAFSPWYPGSYEFSVNVAATDSFAYAAQFSNYHPTVDIAAPGADIISTFPFDQYKIRNGTSFAAPQVSGALARLVALYPELSRIERERILLSHTEDFLSTGGIPVGLYGRGELRVTTAQTIVEPYVEMSSPIVSPTRSAYRSGDQFSMFWTVEHTVPEDVPSTQHTRFTNTFLYDEFNTSATVRNSVSIEAFPGTTIDSVHGYNTSLYAELTLSTDDENAQPLARSGVRMVVNPTYDQITSGSWTLTVGSNGTLGYEDYPDNALGLGLNNTQSGKSILYEAGVILTAPEATADMVRGRVSSRANRDFERNGIVQRTGSWFTEIQSTYSCIEESVFEGVQVVQHVRAYPAIEHCFFVQLRAAAAQQMSTDSASVGYFFDLDIGETGRTDSAYWNDQLQCGIATGEDGELLVGIVPLQQEFSAFLMNNDGTTETDPGIFNGFRDEEKWYVFSHGNTPQQTRTTDISMLIGSAPSFFGKNQPLTAEFAIFVAESFDDLVAKVSQIRSIVDVSNEPISSRFGQHRDFIQISPHPLEEAATISWYSTTTESAYVHVYDVHGSMVFQQHHAGSTGVQHVQIPTAGFAAGVYTCVIQQGTSIKFVKAIRR